LGAVDGRFLSSQAAGGFTGVFLGPYATLHAGADSGTAGPHPAGLRRPHRHADFDWFRYSAGA
jgi:alpha-N-arabinofuranosidase